MQMLIGLLLVYSVFFTCSSTIHCGQHTGAPSVDNSRCCECRQVGSLARKHTRDQIARQAGYTKAGWASSQTSQQVREAGRQPGRTASEQAGEETSNTKQAGSSQGREATSKQDSRPGEAGMQQERQAGRPASRQAVRRVDGRTNKRSDGQSDEKAARD